MSKWFVWRGPVQGAMDRQSKFGWHYFFYGLAIKHLGLGVLIGKEGPEIPDEVIPDPLEAPRDE